MNARREAWLRSVALAWLVVLVTGGLVVWLRQTAPTAEPVAVTEEAALEPADVLTCDRLEAGAAVGEVAGERTVSAEVLTCPPLFDGVVVTYVGEVVGDVLARDGGSWVLLNDDDYALRTGPLGATAEFSGGNSGLTVWLPDPLDELATTPGRDDVRGDVLRVEGAIDRADPTDGGGLTLRARDAEVLAEAVAFERPTHWRQVVVGLAAAVLALLVLGGERRRGQR